MNDKGILYQILTEFTGKKADLHPDSVSNLEMGYIFEELIRRFSKAHNEDAGQHYTPREVIELMVNKSLGKKRNHIPQTAIDEICRLYGDFEESKISKIFNVTDFGYTKIAVERPYPPEHPYWQEVEALKKAGKKVLKKLQSTADPDLQDTENMLLNENIQTYFEREVLPYSPDAWIDQEKSVVGYEIPVNRYFYEYTPPQSVERLEGEIKDLEAKLAKQVTELFGDK